MTEDTPMIIYIMMYFHCIIERQVIFMATYNDAVKVGNKQGEEFIERPIDAKSVINSDNITVAVHMDDKTIHLDSGQITKIANAIQNSEKGAPNGVATLNAQGKIPEDQLDIDLTKYTTTTNVETYDEMLALSTTVVPVNHFVFVSDASNDETVDSGWAIYKRVASNGNASDWTKISEKESLDITFHEYDDEIEDAKNEALKLDAAYCTSEEDMESKNLRDGAIVFMLASGV